MFLSAVGQENLAPADSSKKLNEAVRQIAEEHHLPSFAVAISRDGKIVYSSAIGFADLEHNVPAGPDTVYPIGSITKTVTAAAALRLAERGELDLDAPIQKYCPAFPEKSHPITTHQLLAHLAGIRHYDYRRFEEDFLNRKIYASIEDAMHKFSADDLVAEPGTKYHYSSWGYVVAGCVIEGASGLSYADAIQRDVLKPAGMESTRLDVVQQIIPHRARGYSANDDGSWSNSGCFNASDRYPAGGLVASAEDLVRLANAVLEGRVLKASSIKMMTSQQSTSSGEGTGRGLGFEIGDDGAEFYHGGTSFGASSYLYIRPGDGVIVGFVTNLTLWTKPRLEVARGLADLASGME
jgi:CubicO group peptidase (beta-lactamase class C family)